MTGTSLNAILFLISLLFDFYISILIIRVILAWVGADYHQPLTHFVVNATNFFIKPLKKILPDFRGLEFATLAAILIVEIIKYFFITALSFGMPNIIGLIILALGDSLRLIIQILSLGLILQVILSWIQPNSPLYYTLAKFTSPMMRPIQRVIPPVSGIDLTPFFALIILQLLVIILVNPLKGIGLGIAIGA